MKISIIYDYKLSLLYNIFISEEPMDVTEPAQPDSEGETEPAQSDSEAGKEPTQPDSEPDHADSIYVHDLDSFVRADIQVQGRRHIVLASDNMVSLLQQAKTWYIDATFKVVKDPFSQLFTVHAFVR